MAHSRNTDALTFTVPSPSSRLSTLQPLAARALEEFILFYAGRKASPEELTGVSRIGILELIQVWVLRGNAVDFLDTYEKYLTAIAELVAVYGGELSDILTLEEAKPRSFVAELMFGSQPPAQSPTLHPTVKRETYEHARRRRHSPELS